MNALRQLGSRVSEQLAGGRRPVDYSTITTDRELYDRGTFAKFEDLDAQEQKAILDVRAEVVADPKAWAQAYFIEAEGLNKRVRYAMFSFTHRAAGPTGDHEAAAAFDIAAHELRDAGVLPWYEIVVRGPQIPGQPRVTFRLPENGRGDAELD